MTSTLFSEKINRLEKQVQLLKIESVLHWRKMIKEISIVKRTCGLLEAKFSKGIDFENSLRKGWKKNIKQISLTL